MGQVVGRRATKKRKSGGEKKKVYKIILIIYNKKLCIITIKGFLYRLFFLLLFVQLFHSVYIFKLSKKDIMSLSNF